MATLVRRRKLGRTSVREISRLSKTGIKHCRNDLGIPNDDVYIRWGCAANLPNPNAKVLNKAAAIHEVNSKLDFRLKLNEEELCPATWVDTEEVPDHFIRDKVVIRPPSHAQGRRLYVANTRPEMEAICARLGRYYISPLINKVAEYRVFVVAGRVACVAQKTPANPNDVAWNVAKGGRFDNVRWGDWPLKAVRYAVEAFNLTSLDFGGVDVMVDGNNNAYVLEINSAPSLTSPYRQECMAKCLDYTVKKGNERIKLTEQRGGYRKFVHPAVCEEAILV